jgi:hypothetical protein
MVIAAAGSRNRLEEVGRDFQTIPRWRQVFLRISTTGCQFFITSIWIDIRGLQA